MKKFDYQKKPSLIRTLKEPPKKKKKVNWDRVLFLGAIFIGLFFLLRHVYRSLAVVEADGQVMLESVKVNFINDIRLKNLNVVEGDTIEALDTLFTYWNELHNDDGSMSIQMSSSNDWIRREKLSLLRQMADKRAQLSGIDRMLGELKIKEEKLTKLVMLDATSYTSLQNVSNQILRLENDVDLIKSELYYLNRHYKSLAEQEAQFVDASSGGYSSSITQKMYRAVSKAIVGEIRIQPSEVCYEGDFVFTLHSPDDITIHAYFPQETIDQIYLNEIVNIRFPDGSKGKGYIRKYHVSTRELPSEFQKKYEPTERTILAEIYPIDTYTADLWKRFYKMDVKVSIPKFGKEKYFDEGAIAEK